ncbi:protein disks lost [Drosophila guanche]|uniref:Blast:Protein disks lost n=1 Tax=Drosophila guanche TaxID=7266 RepID=A0A3B0KN64_DROGU|nr:protein disks lost [Drosophila guanche]SPP85248.1 blast:Protein disks lost [Drosophila guanche]
MNRLEETQLQQLLTNLEKISRPQLPQKFLSLFKKGQTCSLEDFAVYFLAAVRQHTEQHFRGSKSDTTPQCLTPVRQLKPPPEDSLNESLTNQSAASANSSMCTPGRQQQSQGRRSTGSGQFCSTPQSANRSGGAAGDRGQSFCLGDFLSNTPTQAQQRSTKKKTTPQQQQLQQQQQASNSAAQAKPRRRVLPMTISRNVSASSSFGDTSSFSNDNNLWRLSQCSEIFDCSQGAALDMEARKSLLLHKQEIKSEAPVSVAPERGQEDEGTSMPDPVPVKLDDVKSPGQLQVLSAIYGQLMDLNLVPNVLGELGFVLQLLNVHDSDVSPSQSVKDLDLGTPLQRLGLYQNCIYFALQLLEHQQYLLLQLDRKSLGVLLQHERLGLLPQPLLQKLDESCQRKQELAKKEITSSSLTVASPGGQQNVYYHEEKDSRDNFPNQNEFRAFKSQRDLFYKTFKLWETSHLNRVFCFSRDVTPRVREIFKVSEHAVNMAHFAKLFVSQLLISGSETTESPEELGLKLDQQRLNRLAQRLVTSNSSVEDQFPRSQAFFRDFISECVSMPFLVQLKLALYVQLVRQNDSTFELQQLAEDVVEEERASQQGGPFTVRAQTMANILTLAKFLGYVTALPYNRCAGQPQSYLCQQQLQLRSHFQPDFNLRELLERSMANGKLLITLPWLVQYLVMLDLVTLQLPNSLATLELLYALYAAMPAEKLQPGAVFIARTCLGWLMEAQPDLVTGYYSHRALEAAGLGTGANAAIVETCLSTFRSLKAAQLPQMEELLPVACPYLHEFRVSITPSRQSQSTGRSGRFRYITTRLEQLTQSAAAATSSATGHPAVVAVELSPAEQQQRKLADAFLHSQNASTRRLIEFVTERSFKCVVKDAQQKILLPSKAAADSRVNEISSMQYQEVFGNIQEIYQETKSQACQHWADRVPRMLKERIEQSLEALLPESTNEVLRATYAQLIRGQAQIQLQQWLQSNVMQSSFYHGDLQELTSKVCRANKNKLEAAGSGSSSEMQLTLDVGFSLSDMLYQLQQWLHCVSLRPQSVADAPELCELLQQIQHAVQLPQLPTVFYHLIGSCLVRLVQLLISREPRLLTTQILSASCAVWRTPQYSASEPASPGIFDALLTVNFIHEVGENPISLRLLEQLLFTMLEEGVLNVDQLNELFLPLFKENWPPTVWSALSQMLQHLSQGQYIADKEGEIKSPEDEAKSHLFMEMLADLSRDMDSF